MTPEISAKQATVCKGCSEPFGASHSINGHCLEYELLEAAEAERAHLEEAAELIRQAMRDGHGSHDNWSKCRDWFARDQSRPSTAARSGSVGGEAGACHKCGGAAQVNDGDDGIGPPVCVNCYDAEWVPPQPPAPDSDTVLLLNLLARIHGDGGHRVIAVGVEQACAEADLMVAKWRACDGCSCICGGTCGCPCHDDEPGIDERRAALQRAKP